MSGAIAYVHLGDVKETWQQLKPTLPAEMDDFATYYEKTWIGTDNTAQSTYVYSLDLEPPRISPSLSTTQFKHGGGMAQWVPESYGMYEPHHLEIPGCP